MKQIQELIQERKDRGFAMAKQERPKYKNGVWLVRSASNPRQQYQVSLELDGAKCNCEDFKERGIYGIKCKHYWSVEYTLTQTELHSDGSITQTTVTKRKTYPQNWKAYNEASVRQKELYLKTAQRPMQYDTRASKERRRRASFYAPTRYGICKRSKGLYYFLSVGMALT